MNKAALQTTEYLITLNYTWPLDSVLPVPMYTFTFVLEMIK